MKAKKTTLAAACLGLLSTCLSARAVEIEAPKELAPAPQLPASAIVPDATADPDFKPMEAPPAMAGVETPPAAMTAAQAQQPWSAADAVLYKVVDPLSESRNADRPGSTFSPRSFRAAAKRLTAQLSAVRRPVFALERHANSTEIASEALAAAASGLFDEFTDERPTSHDDPLYTQPPLGETPGARLAGLSVPRYVHSRTLQIMAVFASSREPASEKSVGVVLEDDAGNRVSVTSLQDDTKSAHVWYSPAAAAADRPSEAVAVTKENAEGVADLLNGAWQRTPLFKLSPAEQALYRMLGDRLTVPLIEKAFDLSTGLRKAGDKPGFDGTLRTHHRWLLNAMVELAKVHRSRGLHGKISAYLAEAHGLLQNTSEGRLDAARATANFAQVASPDIAERKYQFLLDEALRYKDDASYVSMVRLSADIARRDGTLGPDALERLKPQLRKVRVLDNMEKARWATTPWTRRVGAMIAGLAVFGREAFSKPAPADAKAAPAGFMSGLRRRLPSPAAWAAFATGAIVSVVAHAGYFLDSVGGLVVIYLLSLFVSGFARGFAKEVVWPKPLERLGFWKGLLVSWLGWMVGLAAVGVMRG